MERKLTHLLLIDHSMSDTTFHDLAFEMPMTWSFINDNGVGAGLEVPSLSEMAGASDLGTIPGQQSGVPGTINA